MNTDTQPESQAGSGLGFAVPLPQAPGRSEFWADTCREVRQMHHSSAPIVQLYSKYGCRFCEPAREQVEEVLRALDSAMPQWDRAHPELFYQTLELNFPELVRHA